MVAWGFWEWKCHFSCVFLDVIFSLQVLGYHNGNQVYLSIGLQWKFQWIFYTFPWEERISTYILFWWSLEENFVPGKKTLWHTVCWGIWLRKYASTILQKSVDMYLAAVGKEGDTLNCWGNFKCLFLKGQFKNPLLISCYCNDGRTALTFCRLFVSLLQEHHSMSIYQNKTSAGKLQWKNSTSWNKEHHKTESQLEYKIRQNLQ